MADNKPEQTADVEKDVKVSKKVLESIVSRMEELEASNKKIQEENKAKDADIEMLKSISDKARLAKYEQQSNSSIIRTAKVSFWNDVAILAWQTSKDYVGFKDGRVLVDQRIKLFLDKLDEEKNPVVEEVDYLYWVQNTRSKSGDIIEKKDKTSGSFYTIKLPDGKIVELDVRYINAF